MFKQTVLIALLTSCTSKSMCEESEVTKEAQKQNIAQETHASAVKCTRQSLKPPCKKFSPIHFSPDFLTGSQLGMVYAFLTPPCEVHKSSDR